MDNVKLIDADKVKDVIDSYYQELNDLVGIKLSLVQIELIKNINKIPAVNAKQIKTAHWKVYAKNYDIGDAEDVFVVARCSKCRKFIGKFEADGKGFSYKYCPNCGAKMEEVKGWGD